MFNTTLVGLLSSTARIMNRVGLENQTEAVIDYAKNPLTYLGLFAIYKVATSTKSTGKVKINP
jgi:hypothetical protein